MFDALDGVSLDDKFQFGALPMSSKRKIVNKQETRAWVRRLSREIANPAHVGWFEGAVIDHLENSGEVPLPLSPRGKDSLPTISRVLFVFVPTYKFVPDPAFESQCQHIARWLSKLPESDPRLSASLDRSSAFGFDDAMNRVRQEQRRSSIPCGESHVVTKQDGTREWYRDGQLHREDGPAVEHACGTVEWYREGKLHRVGGPAVEGEGVGKEWHFEGKVHREDGPAVVFPSGYQEWRLHGELHREDGPAVIWPDGREEWYLNDEKVSREDVFGRAPSM